MRSFYIALLIILIVTVRSININLKSKTLSRLLGQDPLPNENDERISINSHRIRNETNIDSDSKSKTSFANRVVSFDLSGRVDTCIVGYPKCATVDHCVFPDRRVVPLCRWKDDKVAFLSRPMISVGANYDFQRVWFGVTRFITTLSWKSAYRKEDIATNSNCDDQTETNSSFETNLSFEKGLSRDDYSAEFAVDFEPGVGKFVQKNQYECTRKLPSISIRLDNRSYLTDSRRFTFAGCAPIHPRLDVIVKSTIKLEGPIDHPDMQVKGKTTPSKSYFSSRLPTPRATSEEATWLPDITITPGGRFVSKSVLGLWDQNGSTPNDRSPLRWYNGMRTGIRLVASRQLNWNVLGMSQELGESNNDTLLRLDLSGLNRGGNTYSSVIIEGALERLRESTRVTLLQERIKDRL